MKKNDIVTRVAIATGGFSLVETLVAVSLLLLVVVGPLTITSRTSRSTEFASEQVVAHFLAQEGIELAQKRRDDLLLQYYEDPLIMSNPWYVFYNPSSLAWQSCYSASGCGLFWNNSNVINLAPPKDCASADACRLWLAQQKIRSKYTHEQNALYKETPFTRKIRFIKNNTNSNEVWVVSEVTWRTGSLIANQTVRVETALFNIYDTP